jgi:hypothetical protein
MLEKLNFDRSTIHLKFFLHVVGKWSERHLFLRSVIGVLFENLNARNLIGQELRVGTDVALLDIKRKCVNCIGNACREV